MDTTSLFARHLSPAWRRHAGSGGLALIGSSLVPKQSSVILRLSPSPSQAWPLELGRGRRADYGDLELSGLLLATELGRWMTCSGAAAHSGSVTGETTPRRRRSRRDSCWVRFGARQLALEDTADVRTLRTEAFGKRMVVQLLSAARTYPLRIAPLIVRFSSGNHEQSKTGRREL